MDMADIKTKNKKITETFSLKKFIKRKRHIVYLSIYIIKMNRYLKQEV